MTESEKNEKIAIVRRSDLEFNESECQMINFADITAYKQLEQGK